MLSYREAVQRFEALRTRLRIPPDAEFFSVEKRHIEQFPTGEIEGGEAAPDAAPPTSPDASHAAPESAPAAAQGEESEGGPGDPGITERLVWVAEFTHGFMFWEAAIDANGDLVRLRKSR